jgi:hypothetical protein
LGSAVFWKRNNTNEVAATIQPHVCASSKAQDKWTEQEEDLAQLAGRIILLQDQYIKSKLIYSH